ncbi:hypothetical protein N431DRAFT_481407 [Stipitochalara longipes BDJ]|nr:hypothetical protein N431DRAFT_481407 [Stipitochalara longipes BDJ]
MDFDLPDAKRIRRADLYTSRTPSPSPSPEAETTTLLHSRLASLYGPLPTLEPSTQAHTSPPPNPQEEGFEFRLFSAPSTSARTQKIVLQNEQEESASGFIKRERDKAFYIAAPATGEALSAIQFAALSGEEVLKLAQGRNWGLEVPWRVSVLRVGESGSKAKARARDGEKGQVGLKGDMEGEKKKKPGKKRRVVLRERERARVKKEEAKIREREGREEAEREKRTRRNREKKVKRKMKEKALKAGSGHEEVEKSGGES